MNKLDEMSLLYVFSKVCLKFSLFVFLFVFTMVTSVLIFCGIESTSSSGRMLLIRAFELKFCFFEFFSA